MNVSSPLEIPLTILGWLLYDRIWGTLMETGVAFLPFLFLLLKTWVRAREKMDDVEAARATLRTLETRLIVMFSVIVLAAQPFFNLSITGLNFSKKQCDSGTETTASVAGGSTGTSFDTTFSSTTLGGGTALVPVWWYGVMAISGGLTNAAIAALPCNADLRGMSYKLNLNPVSNDPALTRETGRFYRECFLKAMRQLQLGERQRPPAGTEPSDVEWLGSPFFMTSSGYYPDFYAERPVPGFAPDPNRLSDRHAAAARGTVVAALPEGLPRCSEWWRGTTLDNGLQSRLLLHLIEPAPQNYLNVVGLFNGAYQSVREAVTGLSADDLVLRNLLLKDHGVIKGLSNRALAGGYNNVNSLSEGIAGVPAWFGSKWEKASFYPMVLMIREATRNVQAVLLLAVYALLPFVLVISQYSFSTLLLASGGVFALKFMGFIWALAYWLDTRLIDSMRSAGMITGVAFFDVRKDVIDFVTGASYLVLPVVWLTILTWAGMKIGGELAQSANSLGKNAGGAGARGGGTMRDVAIRSATSDKKK